MTKKANKPPAKIQQADSTDVAAITGRRQLPHFRPKSLHFFRKHAYPVGIELLEA
jgi:hypothetical protein